MNLNRRALVAGSGGSILAMIPLHFVGAQDGSPTPVAGPIPLELDRVRLIGISPDGHTLVGREIDELVFIDADSIKEISRTDLADLAEVADTLDPESISWSPDGSRIAFSQQAWLQMADSDIHIVNVATGEVTNITDEDGEGEPESLWEVTDPTLDMYPVWLDDESLLFYRHTGSIKADGDRMITLVTAAADGSNIETWVDLFENDIQHLYDPMQRLSNGRVLVRGDANSGTPEQYVTLIENDGTLTRLDLEGVPVPFLEDANDSHCLVSEPEKDAVWYVPLDDPAAKQQLHEVLGFEEFDALLFPTALGAEPNTFVTIQGEQEMTLLMYNNGDVQELTRFEDDPIRSIHWVGNRILLIGGIRSWFVDLN